MKKILKNIGCTNIKKENTRFESYSFFYTSDNLKVKGFIMLPKIIKNPGLTPQGINAILWIALVKERSSLT